MNANEFVSNWKKEKESMLSTYTHESPETEVSNLILEMNLNQSQLEIMSKVIDNILTDTFYALLLGLDGAASIGSTQQSFEIKDESGNLISEQGEIEAEAWEQFHG